MSPVELLCEEQGAKARCTPVNVDLPPSTFDVDCKYKECLVILADTLTYHIFSYLCISQKEWWYSSQNLLRKVFFVFLASLTTMGFLVSFLMLRRRVPGKMCTDVEAEVQ
jgi:hypothetical protein